MIDCDRCHSTEGPFTVYYAGRHGFDAILCQGCNHEPKGEGKSSPAEQGEGR